MKSSCPLSSRTQPILRWPRLMLPPVLVMAAMAMTMAGCGKRHGDRSTLYPAEGQVLWNSKPLGGAQVVFYPTGLADEKFTPSRAQTNFDGRFSLGTYATADGAPEGEYAVTVVCYPMRPKDGGAGPNVLPKKYASPKTTDLRVKIASDTSTLPTLVLNDPQRPANSPGLSSGREARE
jgi:hypothetical protein